MADAGEPAPAEESLALLEAGGEGAVLPSKGPPELRIMLLGLWLMSCAGLQYSFSTYSPVVVANLRLTQSQLGIMALGKVRGAAGTTQALDADWLPGVRFPYRT